MSRSLPGSLVRVEELFHHVTAPSPATASIFRCAAIISIIISIKYHHYHHCNCREMSLLGDIHLQALGIDLNTQVSSES